LLLLTTVQTELTSDDISQYVWRFSMISKIMCLVIVSNRTRAGFDFPAAPHGNNSSFNLLPLKSKNTYLDWVSDNELYAAAELLAK
jgi:hypothetical protein